MSAGVRTGYKQTEVGVIPIDWLVREFRDVTEVITCGVAATPTYVSESIGMPFLSAQNVRNGRVVWDKYRFISFDLFQQITRHNKPEQGDILYTRVGAGIGEAGIVEAEVPFGIYVSLTLIKIDKKQVVNGFILNLLNSPKYRLIAKGGQFAGGGVQNLNVDVVRNFLIPVPPVNEQRAIATALSDVDALLSGLDSLIAKKQNLKQAAMQQLLTGQTRLPGFSGEWEVKRLGDMVSLYQPVTISAYQFTESGFPVYGANGVVGFYHSTNHETWQVTVTCRGSTCGTVNRTVEKCWITGNAMVLNCDQNRILNKEFLYHLMLGQDLSDCITGTGQPQIVRSPLAAVCVRLPIDIEEQSAIATVLSDMDTELAALQSRRDKTRALKQGMMQELLTGRIRLV